MPNSAYTDRQLALKLAVELRPRTASSLAVQDALQDAEELLQWLERQGAGGCHAPNCQQHGKSPCEGIGCDGRTEKERHPERGWRS